MRRFAKHQWVGWPTDKILFMESGTIAIPEKSIDLHAQTRYFS
jgi:hypothetical protein